MYNDLKSEPKPSKQLFNINLNFIKKILNAVERKFILNIHCMILI